MYFKILKTDEELELYRKAAHRYIEALLPLEYLRRSRVIACIDDREKICGGFVLVLKGPFRVLEQIPEDRDPDLAVNTEKAAEITGFWRTRSWWQNCGSASLWLRLGWEMIRSGKRCFLYSYSLRKPALGQIYSFVKPKVVYRGEVFLAGMDGSDRESVEIFSFWNLVGAFFRSPSFLLARIRPAVIRKKGRAIS